MMEIVTLAGSPSASSRSAAVLALIRDLLAEAGVPTTALAARDLPPEDLVYGRYDSPAIQAAGATIQQARAVVVATPVYKAAYSGVLKAFLDLLPAGVLADKPVLPIATGGAPTHALAIEYALNPVLTALGATRLLSGIYIIDSQIEIGAGGQIRLDPAIDQRLRQAVAALSRESTAKDAKEP